MEDDSGFLGRVKKAFCGDAEEKTDTKEEENSKDGFEGDSERRQSKSWQINTTE